ncbi:MAG: DUF2085 domain-containing protein [Ignavibacteriales bacterium]|nr:DUF2085 domain-containing protein [Ignavibacteriales bacterium]
MKRSYSLILFFLFLIWFLGIFIEWFIKIDEHFVFALPYLQKTYSLVCHQEKNKLLLFDGIETLTCARCTGIYLGLLLSSLLVLFKLPKRKLHIKILLVAAAPMIADVLLTSLNIYAYSKLIAFFTGLLLGSFGFFYLYAGLNNLILELKK